jgi:hypothetical protein
MYLKASLGQDDSLNPLAPTVDLSAVDLSSAGFVTSPVFLGGVGLLLMAFLVSRGKRAVKKVRKTSAKRAAVKAQIKALQAGL